MGFNSINRSRKLERNHTNGNHGNRPPAAMFTGSEFKHGAAITASWVANPAGVDALLAEMRTNSKRPFRRKTKPVVVAQAKAPAPIDPRKLAADLRALVAEVKAEREAEAGADLYRRIFGDDGTLSPHATAAEDDLYRAIYAPKGA